MASGNSSRRDVGRPVVWPAEAASRRSTTGRPAPRRRARPRLRPATGPSVRASYTGKALALAYSNRGVEWTAQGRCSPAPSPTTTRPSSTIRRRRRPTTIAASPVPARSDFDNAIADYDEAIRLNPKYASALWATAALPTSTRASIERAIADYDEAIRLAPDAVGLNNRGNAYASRGEFDRAIRDFDEAVNARRALRHRALQSRQRAFRQGRRRPRASRDYDQALAIDPKYQDALVNRGVAYETQGPDRPRDRRLRRGASSSIRRMPSRSTIAAMRCSRRARPTRAIADYDQALRLDGKYVAAYFSRAIAHESRRQYFAAIADYEHVTRLQPPNAAAWNSRCWTRAVDRPAAGGARATATKRCGCARTIVNALDSRALRASEVGPLRRGDRRLRRGACASIRRRSRRCTVAAWPSAGSTISRRQRRHRRGARAQARRSRWSSRATGEPAVAGPAGPAREAERPLARGRPC